MNDKSQPTDGTQLNPVALFLTIRTARKRRRDTRLLGSGRPLGFESLESRQLLTGDTAVITDVPPETDSTIAETNLTSSEIAGMRDFAAEVTSTRTPRAPLSHFNDLVFVEMDLSERQITPNGLYEVHLNGRQNRMVVRDADTGQRLWRKRVDNRNFDIYAFYARDEGIYVHQQDTSDDEDVPLLRRLGYPEEGYVQTINPPGGIHVVGGEFPEPVRFVVDASESVIVGTDHTERWIDLITGELIEDEDEEIFEPAVTYDNIGRIVTIEMQDEAQTTVNLTYLDGTADSRVSEISKTFQGPVPPGEPAETVFKMSDMSVTEKDSSGNVTDTYRFEKLDVQQLGARGDGAFDDTLLLETALRTGLNVFLPAGTYRVTDTLKMTNKGQILSGVGADSAVLAYEGQGHALTIEATSFIQVRTLELRTAMSGIVIAAGPAGAISTNHKIDDVTLTGPGAEVPGSRLVVFSPLGQGGANYFHTIQNSRLSHAEIAVEFTADPNSANAQRVINSDFSHYKTAMQVGSDENMILGVQFHDDAGTPAEPAVGIRLLSGSTFDNIHGIFGTDTSTHTLIVIDSGAKRNAVVNIPAGVIPVDNGSQTLVMNKVTDDAVADLTPQEIPDGTTTSYHLSDFGLSPNADITDILRSTLQQGVRTFIPPGTYRITEQIRITGQDNIILEGSGARATTLIYDNPNAAPGADEFGIVLDDCDNCAIRNIRIQTQNSGILVSGNSTNVGLELLDVTNIGDPVGHTAVEFDVTDTGATNYLANSQVGKAEKAAHVAGGSVNLFNNTYYRYYAGVYLESNDNLVTGGFFHQAPGFGPNDDVTVGAWLAGSASGNTFVGMVAEPGVPSTTVHYEQNTSNNTVVVLRNAGILPNDLGTDNSTYSKLGAKTAEILAGDSSGTTYGRTAFLRELSFVSGPAPNEFTATVTSLPTSLAENDIITLAKPAGLGGFDLQIIADPATNSIEIVWTWNGSGTAPNVDGTYYFTIWHPR